MQANPSPPPPAASAKLILTEHEQTKLSTRGYAIQSDTKLGGFGDDIFPATLNGRPIVAKQSVWPLSRVDLQLIAGALYDTMNRIRHPHILAFYDIFLLARSELIFLERCEGGDLQHHLDGLKEPKWLDEPQAIQYFLQFGYALRFLHKRGLAQRSVHPNNIYMDRSKQVCKLGYFGQTNQSDGNPAYKPPEEYLEDDHHEYPHADLAGDVWRAGITLYVMLNGGDAAPRPLGGQIQQIKKMDPEKQLQYPNATVSQSARRVIASILIPDPWVRPTMDKILTEPFIQSCIFFD